MWDTLKKSNLHVSQKGREWEEEIVENVIAKNFQNKVTWTDRFKKQSEPSSSRNRKENIPRNTLAKFFKIKGKMKICKATRRKKDTLSLRRKKIQIMGSNKAGTMKVITQWIEIFKVPKRKHLPALHSLPEKVILKY
jgi:hypothetical protein